MKDGCSEVTYQIMSVVVHDNHEAVANLVLVSHVLLPEDPRFDRMHVVREV